MNAYAETTDTGNLLVRLWYCVDQAHVQDLIDKAFRACPEGTQLEIMKELYDSFLGEPGGHKAHELLHTKYVERPVYK